MKKRSIRKTVLAIAISVSLIGTSVVPTTVYADPIEQTENNTEDVEDINDNAGQDGSSEAENNSVGDANENVQEDNNEPTSQDDEESQDENNNTEGTNENSQDGDEGIGNAGSNENNTEDVEDINDNAGQDGSSEAKNNSVGDANENVQEDNNEPTSQNDEESQDENLDSNETDNAPNETETKTENGNESGSESVTKSEDETPVHFVAIGESEENTQLSIDEGNINVAIPSGAFDFSEDEEGLADNQQVIAGFEFDTTVNSAEIANAIVAIVDENDNVEIHYVGIDINKYIATFDGGNITDTSGGTPITELKQAIEIGIPVASLGIASPKAVYILREHEGNISEFDELTARPASGYTDGAFFYDEGSETVYIYSQYFSTFAVATSQVPKSAAGNDSGNTSGNTTATNNSGTGGTPSGGASSGGASSSGTSSSGASSTSTDLSSLDDVDMQMLLALLTLLGGDLDSINEQHLNTLLTAIESDSGTVDYTTMAILLAIFGNDYSKEKVTESDLNALLEFFSKDYEEVDTFILTLLLSCLGEDLDDVDDFSLAVLLACLDEDATTLEDWLATIYALLEEYSSESLNVGALPQTTVRALQDVYGNISVSWSAIANASEYRIYVATTDDEFQASPSLTVKSGQQLMTKFADMYPTKVYKIKLEAVDAMGQVIASPNTAYIAGGYSDYTNAQNVALPHTTVNMVKDSTYQIGAQTILADASKQLLPSAQVSEFRYSMSNPDVATVDANGNVTAVGSGSCDIYVHAQNGVTQIVKIFVQ